MENKKLNLTEQMSKDYIDNAMKKIQDNENKRHSLPNVQLTEVELEILKGIAQGRNSNELNKAIQHNKINTCYNSVIHVLLKKFEAYTIAHVIYKAMKMKILD